MGGSPVLFYAETRLKAFGEGVFVHHHVDCLCPYEAVRHVEITFGVVALSAPGILGHVVFCAVLVFGDTKSGA